MTHPIPGNPGKSRGSRFGVTALKTLRTLLTHKGGLSDYHKDLKGGARRAIFGGAGLNA